MLYGTGHRLRGITIMGHGCLEHAMIMHSPRTYCGAKSEVNAVDLAAVDIALLLEPATVVCQARRPGPGGRRRRADVDAGLEVPGQQASN